VINITTLLLIVIGCINCLLVGIADSILSPRHGGRDSTLGFSADDIDDGMS
jgi:hypothetical protein